MTGCFACTERLYFHKLRKPFCRSYLTRSCVTLHNCLIVVLTTVATVNAKYNKYSDFLTS